MQFFGKKAYNFGALCTASHFELLDISILID